MNRTIQLILAALVAAAVSGCASTGGYWADRGRDAADVFTCTVGVGTAGAKARVGPVCAGLLAQSDITGLRNGRFFMDPPPIFAQYDLLLGCWGVENITGNERKDAVESTMVIPFIYGGNFFSVPPDLPAYYYCQIEAVATLGMSLRLGFNPGELLDFLLGFSTIDIFGDDIAAKERKKAAEKSRESLSPESLSHQNPGLSDAVTQ